MKTKFKKFNVTLPGIAGNEPPTEFRIFRAGVNESSKGPALFDSLAAEKVMTAFAQGGVDLSIDLEHLSLDPESNNYSPDARGWFQLEVRDGELWAVNVRWTPDGERRLRERTQRYISPVFAYEEKTNRVTLIYNAAICANPATYATPALIAASKTAGHNMRILSVEVPQMLSEELKKIAKQLGLDPEKASLEDIMSAIATLQDDDGDGKPDEEVVSNSDDADEDKDTEKLTKLLSKHPMLLGRTVAARVGIKALAKDVADLKKNQATTEVEQLIAANTNKIPLTLEAWARTQTPEVLRSYLKSAPESARKPATPPEETTVGDAVLTAEDLKIAALTNVSPEKMKERRAKEIADKKARLAQS